MEIEESFEFEPNVVATGSTGNFLVLNDIIAFDMGVPFKMVRPYSKKLKLVLVCHQHFDHLKPKTVSALARNRPSLRFAVGPWLVPILVDCGVPARSIDVVEAGNVYDYGKFQIEPFPLHHNVPNFGFKIYMNGKKALYAVDTGFIADLEAKNFDLYLLERNHTEAEIQERIERKRAAGEFAYEYAAANNHLSEEQALDWLSKNAGKNSKYIFLHQHIQSDEQHEN